MTNSLVNSQDGGAAAAAEPSTVAADRPSACYATGGGFGAQEMAPDCCARYRKMPSGRMSSPAARRCWSVVQRPLSPDAREFLQAAVPGRESRPQRRLVINQGDDRVAVVFLAVV